jgi:uncharacterized protein YqcC (DUF446 family)
MADALPEHSPLGASGSHRWMECPRSVTLSAGWEDEESDFAATGTAAHALGEYCLTHGDDAWEWVGATLDGTTVEVDQDMANAAQEYLDYIRVKFPDRNQGNSWLERGFRCESLHYFFYGRADFVYADFEARTLYVTDYKNGAGIVVDVEDNPQLKYYGIGMLEDLQLWKDIDKVVLTVVQPNGFHYDGPIRSWAISTLDLEEWLDDVLIPAMDHATVSRDTKSGDHCRFCPARFGKCPQLEADMGELEELMELIDEKGGAKELNNAEIGRYLDLFDVAKIVEKALSKVAFGRLSAGKKIPNRKLVKARSHRAWKEGAEKEIKKQFGDKAYTEPKLKSPAQIEALPGGDKFSARWGFKPEGGLTIGKGEDNRPAVNRDTKSMFKDQTKKGKKNE